MAEPYDTYKNDWEYIEGIQDVTYTPQNGTAATGVKALREPVPLRAQAGLDFGGGIGKDFTLAVFVLWDMFLAGLVPAGGGVIRLADNSDWVVVRSQSETFETRWRCIANKTVS